VVRHLHLVDCAYACLIHVGIKTYRAQGQNKSQKVLRLEPVSELKDRMRRMVWQENVQDVIKYRVMKNQLFAAWKSSSRHKIGQFELFIENIYYLLSRQGVFFV
jgi:hypothetical protein